MIKKCLIFTFFCISVSAFSQTLFYNSGSIQFQRKTNAFRLTEGGWMNRMYEKNKFLNDTFRLDFDSSQSLYFNPSYDPDEGGRDGMYFSMSVNPSKSNVVYKNHNSDTLWVMRELFDERIVIHDSIRKIQWKITDEVREIAGFSCHKAIGILFDSMYVVAFYTDQIITQSGPESFGNLPGMILGVAIPRLHTTWMAIDFKAEKPSIKKPSVPKKKKTPPYNWNNYYLKLSERFKDWGAPFNNIMVWMWGV